MAFPNVRRMVRIGSPVSSYKLILAVGTSSRPCYRRVFLLPLWLFVRNGEFPIRYRCYERYIKIHLRLSDLTADVLSVRELAVSDIYRLQPEFSPDFVIDGGGNIGLFTLRAAAAAESVGSEDVRFIVCEPLPRNIAQIRKHLAMNGVLAEILPCCLGGARGTIPFYCRGANESSFDASLPYESILDVPVKPLRDVIPSSAERILIKLDIEGMEIETLEAFIASEQRPVYIVGELHDYPRNASRLERLFHECGWPLEMFDVDQLTCTFRACSPQAIPLLPWARAGNEKPAAATV